MSKYIFVTGGVSSALGKGVTASSIAKLLKDSGLKVFMQKFDPYINVDPGTMSPYQHGEVFVTVDGAETDLDLGHYERFIDEELTYLSNITTGRLYKTIIEKERAGDYNGETVQIVPHVTNEIKKNLFDAAKQSKADVIITEIGGTVGDIESLPFIESLRQVWNEQDEKDVLFVHVTLVPYINAAGELKTKPTQNSVKSLRSLGIQPDIIVCRCERDLDSSIKNKIALFTNVRKERVFEAKDAESIFDVPLSFAAQGLDKQVKEKLGIKNKPTNLKNWEKFVTSLKSISKSISVAIVGKYVSLQDAYLSVSEAIKSAGWNNMNNIDIKWINSEEINKTNVKEKLKGVDGIVVPGGFGKRGIDGKIITAQYARENKVPYLGLCLGMQVAAIEFARNVCGLADADSTEWNEDTKNPIIDIIRGTTKDVDLGGTLRLGNYEATIKKNTIAHKLYGDHAIERHRHRFEFNNDYINMFEEKGMIISGVFKEKNLVEIIELKDHPFFVATQAHPEFTSRPNKANPLFDGFIKACISK